MSRRAKINTRNVQALKAGDLLWDSELSGFCVRCQRRDKVYAIKYRVGARQLGPRRRPAVRPSGCLVR